MRFEDEARHEQIYIHGQKDMDMVINNSHREEIGNDQHLTVGHDKFEHIEQHLHSNIGQDHIAQVGRDHHEKIGHNVIQRVLGMVKRYIGGGMITQIEGSSRTSIGASEQKIIGDNQRIKVTSESSLHAKKIVLEVTDESTFNSLSNFIKIDNDGITFSGDKVMINLGGVAGKGTAPKPISPDEFDLPHANLAAGMSKVSDVLEKDTVLTSLRINE
ncbi:bacteriophage T4 gp5 trimerisation domain-containing protein [Vibrio sp. MA40-2]|uniref:bacteriophage T4 gp5 trimerisation domain-containing protein n=1 Tax=Vibrio sp. MA40-2 TaxID=3391828 RepID=UPI0039A77701